MKTKISAFLNAQKPMLASIITDLSKEFKYVSILGTDCAGQIYKVSKSGTEISESMFTDRGFVIRVFNGINYSEYSFDAIKDASEIKDQIRMVASKDIAYLTSKKIDLIESPLIEDDENTFVYQSDFEIDPFQVSPEDKIAKLTEIMNLGLKENNQFVDFRVSYEQVRTSKLFLSTKKDLAQSLLYSVVFLIPIGKSKDGIKYDFVSLAGNKGFEILDEAQERISEVAQSVTELFESKPVIPGEYDIICDPRVSGLIAHEAFGHGVEMDMFVRNRAKGADFINQRVASDKVNMRDGAKSMNHVASYLFDDEGTFGSDTQIIENGVLKTGISDLLSAYKLNSRPTGNGRRQGFERKAYARMTNTFFEPGNDTLDDMIASVDKGYLLEGYFSGMEDPKNWGIQCVIVKGREIIDGHFSGKIVSPITLTGYVPDMLQSISMVSDGQVKLDGAGLCGKGNKEYVKASSGGTYIKTKGRLS